MATMHVELVSIEEALWSGEATAVYARTVVGQLGILPGHTPLLGALAPGFAVRIDQEDGQSLSVAVHGGFLSVRKDGVSVLAEQAEMADDIDVSRAREALDRTNPDDGPDEKAAHDRALARLRAAGESV
ncbi:F0F1 ATP synthase subunit epsilon [Jatrophihabitans endophyticus]|uniref:F0F1 ATP synthase subunit epsilon n=1 Tax=Jatrophihabitans endophyticus TaxID=1206085 RepID=UPI0019ED37F6|nr:F0F1 ATP synthase subunit epsilon [Jatrophihabitans endophyticus]MBE7186883.1 F0F1 ATP synthase subunit epsilon [Jatrophihabitans endophyticus]